MRVLLSSFGSAGDVRPLLGVAWALREAGHEVVSVLDPRWAATAASECGLESVPFGEAWNPSEISTRPDWLDPKRGSARMLRELVIPRTHDLVRTARRVGADLKPDVVVGHHISFGMPWVAEERGVPWVMCAVAPSSWPSIDDPNLYPGMPDRERYPRWTIRLGSLIASKAINRAIDPAVNAVRRELGLSPQRGTMLSGQFSRIRNVGLWSSHFRGPAGDDPPGAAITGFPMLPDNLELPIDVATAIEGARTSGQPIGIWTLGTTAVHSGAAWRDGFIKECTECDVFPVVLTGNEQAATELREAGVTSAAYLAHDAVLPLTDFAVHHAGIGTSAAGLRAGIPSILLPFTHDQPDNARRLRRLGVASVLKPKDRRGAEPLAAIGHQLSAMLGSQIRESSQRLGARVRAEDWAAGVCTAIESIG